MINMERYMLSIYYITKCINILLYHNLFEIILNYIMKEINIANTQRNILHLNLKMLII